MNKDRKLLSQIIYTAIFIALCFAGTFVSIPLGTSKVHLGNFFCVLAGLLCGPFIGGVAGSLGMGFNDIALGYGWNTYLRTFIMKFFMGFLAGYIFRLCLKKKANGSLLLGISTGLSLALFGFMLYMYFVPDSGYSLLAVIAISILSLMMLGGFIASFWLTSSSQCLLFAMIVSLAINVTGEFFLRILFNVVTGVQFDAALVISIVKLPAALFTSLVTIILVVAFFYPIYFSTRKLNYLNDLNPYIALGSKK
mgnify:FL=1